MYKLVLTWACIFSSLLCTQEWFAGSYSSFLFHVLRNPRPSHTKSKPPFRPSIASLSLSIYPGPSSPSPNLGLHACTHGIVSTGYDYFPLSPLLTGRQLAGEPALLSCCLLPHVEGVGSFTSPLSSPSSCEEDVCLIAVKLSP